MVGHFARVGDTRYAYKIEVGSLDVKRKIGRMVCQLNLYNKQGLFVVDQSICNRVNLSVPNRKYLSDCSSGKTVFFLFLGWGESVTMAACYKPIYLLPVQCTNDEHRWNDNC